MRLDSARDLKLSLLEQLLSGRLRGLFPRAADLALGVVNQIAEAPRQASVALGIARRGPRDFRLAVRVQQPSLVGIPLVDLVARRARGETDVRYIGRVRPTAAKDAAWHRDRMRPLLIGSSVGHASSTAGTIGAFVTPRAGAARMAILSNAHILAPAPKARPGDSIVQPGPVDGGKPRRDAVAELARSVPLRPGRTNRVDAACALLRPGIDADPGTIRGVGRLRGIDDQVEPGQRVLKVGRTSGLTQGRISAIEVDNIFVEYGEGRLRFDDQIEIEGLPGRGRGPFSEAGDSGALVMTPTLAAAALLFAGSDHGGPSDRGLTYATPVRTVLDALRVSLRLA